MSELICRKQMPPPPFDAWGAFFEHFDKEIAACRETQESVRRIHERAANLDWQARFRAVDDSAVVVTLVAERDWLKAENDRLRKLPTCWSEVLEQSEACDELLDKVLELGADAERYRFLCDKFGETKLPCALERILAGDLYVADGKPSIDSAIDAAMGKGEPA